MSDDIVSFDINEGHVYFSTRAFNRVWDYIEQGDQRSADEDLMMLHTAIASLWHWTQREDVKPENLSIGYWQVSRVFNLLKQPNNARTYGLQALKYAKGLEPFHKAYAYETLARAEMLANNRVVMMVYLEKAREMTDLVAEAEDKQLLLKDLESIQ
jgi:hypothetical protein